MERLSRERGVAARGASQGTPAVSPVASQYRIEDEALVTPSGTLGAMTKRKSNFALRLQPSLLDEARKLAEQEGVALNQLINVAVAEKLSALRTESYIAQRGARADIPKALDILKRAGVGRAPVKGDELTKRKRKSRWVSLWRL
jgi:hypothetical protein